MSIRINVRISAQERLFGKKFYLDRIFVNYSIPLTPYKADNEKFLTLAEQFFAILPTFYPFKIIGLASLRGENSGVSESRIS